MHCKYPIPILREDSLSSFSFFNQGVSLLTLSVTLTQELSILLHSLASLRRPLTGSGRKLSHRVGAEVT